MTADAAETASRRPAAVSAERLAAVPGVLGQIARERAGDHAGPDAPAPATDAAAAATIQRVARQFRPSFAAALVPATAPAGSETPLAVIAEVKRASPSQGAIAALDPVAAAAQYAAGGAAALSVLTEPRHFGGELEHLRAIAAARARFTTPERPLPLLRKDFTVTAAQIDEALTAGASAVLLIVAVLGPATAAYLDYATHLGLDALVEVHDDAELDVALTAGARIIGVNNRDLTTLHIDLATAPRLITRARSEGFTGLLVAESGYRTRDDLRDVEGLADAVLVGTSLAGSGDLTAALTALRGAV